MLLLFWCDFTKGSNMWKPISQKSFYVVSCYKCFCQCFFFLMWRSASKALKFCLLEHILHKEKLHLNFKLQQLWYKLFPALVLVLGNLNLNLGNVRAGRILHSRFLRNILASPMSFFDMTPTGRILNRFGKDIDVVDTVMAQQIHAWLYCVLRVISVPVVIVYSTPLFLSVIIPLFVPYFVVQVSVALYCVYLVI